jgi:hypothetical protein
MRAINRCLWLASVAALGLAGCAQFAVRPATPAATMDATRMWEPRAEEKFYFIVFGSQTTPKLARFTHSWCTFVRVRERGEGQEPQLECLTMSWMPATLEIHPLRFRVEKGVNLDLHTTLQYVLTKHERISEWGPYECRPRLYIRSQLQKEFLESGEIGYQCIDDIGEAARNGNGCDCIHAMTDQDPLFPRTRYPLRRFGESASKFIVREMWRRGLLVCPEQTHDWLQEALGLDHYPIIRRCYKGKVDEKLAQETRASTTRNSSGRPIEQSGSIP